MTATAELDRILDNFSERLYKLEQGVSTPGSFGYTNEFDEIIIDDGDEVVVITPQPPETPLNVAVLPGSHFDVIYADVSWDAAPTGEPALIYEVELAEETAPGVYDIAQVVRTAGTNFRIQPLEPNTDYGVRVTAMSRIGKLSSPTAWLDFNSGTDNTVPAQITGVAVARGATSAVVTFTPSAEVDVSGGKGLYEVQIDTANTFNTANLKTIRTTSWVVAFTGINTEAGYYARVSAIDSSGNQGPWSATVGPTTVGGVIDSMVVAGLSAAKITVGTMSGDRITANTLDAVAIKTSTITAADITLNGGSFKAGSPPTTGLLINSQGLRLYDSGVQTITLDAATGNATFRGTITSSSISSTDITGGTITGATISVAGGDVVLDTNGITIVSGTGTVNTIKWKSGATTHATISGSSNGISLSSLGASISTTNLGSIWFTAASGRKVEAQSIFNAVAGIEVNGTTVVNTSRKGFFSGGIDATGNITATNQMSCSQLLADTIVCDAFSANSSGSNPLISFAGGDATISPAGSISCSQLLTAHSVVSTVPTCVITSIGLIQRTTHANSSLRYKEKIKVIKPGEVNWDGLMQLKPARFNLKRGILTNDEERYNHYGLIAEEVVEVLPEVVQLDEDGEPDLVDYSKLSIFLLLWNQKLQREVDALKSAA